MGTDDERQRVWRRRPVLVDGVAAAVLLLVDVLLVTRLAERPTPSGFAAVLTVLTLAAMPLRSVRPVPALALVTVLAAGALLLRGADTVAVVAPLLALYTVALRSDRRAATLAWAATLSALLIAVGLGSPRGAFVEEALPVLPWSVAAAAIGAGLGNRRAYVAAVEDRAVRAERSRESEALRRVAEERVHIARELHDVVAHHIAVVSVQAGVAQHLMGTEPAAATEALGHVRRAAGTVLTELGDILAVLREPGEPAQRSDPAPGLDRLDALVDSFSAAGLAVEWSLHGRPRELAPAVDVVAYRILEEALTNALKHGTGSASVDVRYGDAGAGAGEASLRLRVANRTPDLVEVGSTGRAGTAGSGRGHGLVGMRERATALGGALRAGPVPGEGYRVEAELPLRPGGAR